MRCLARAISAMDFDGIWCQREGTPGSLQEVAQAAGWKSAEQPGQWVLITRTFRDGSTQGWWALEIVAGPYGSDKTERAVVATTDPQTLPDLTTWYLVTNLPAPTTCPVTAQQLAPANLEEINDLRSGFPVVNCAKHLLSQVL
jgi:hypothetical protein